jgi:hypothetical protein
MGTVYIEGFCRLFRHADFISVMPFLTVYVNNSDKE